MMMIKTTTTNFVRIHHHLHHYHYHISNLFHKPNVLRCCFFTTQSNNNDENQTNNNNNKVRVRYAPSPTGLMHLGGLRTALYNYLFARSKGGTFILRIEDTDSTRFVEGATENLISSLEWTGIDYDEGPGKGGEFGPYVQSHRKELYQKHAQTLLEKGSAYRCFCTPERLQAMRERSKTESTIYDRTCLKLTPQEIEQKLQSGVPFTIRMKVPKGTTAVDDGIRGKVIFINEQIDDQILIKSDKMPTYHLANVVDDHSMKISHVIRGEEWLTSTPKHIILYKEFGWNPPEFFHLPLLLNSDRSKLSKRQGDVSVESYKNKGFLPSALVNFIAFLGWSPSNANQEIFTKEELIKMFSFDQVNKAGTVVNLSKLEWFNVQHIKRFLAEPEGMAQFVEKVKIGLKEQLGQNEPLLDDNEFIERVVNVVKERVHLSGDFVSLSIPIFKNPDYTLHETAKMAQKLWKHNISENVIKEIIAVLESIQETEFNNDTIFSKLQGVIQTHSLGVVLNLCRLTVTGTPVGAGVLNMIEIIGKEKTLKRMRMGLEHFTKTMPT